MTTLKDLHFEVRKRDQGQIIEVAYRDHRRRQYRRITDTSLPPGHPERVVYAWRGRDSNAAWKTCEGGATP